MDRSLGYVLSMTTLTTRPLLSFMTNPERRSRRRSRQRGDGAGQCTYVTDPSRKVVVIRRLQGMTTTFDVLLVGGGSAGAVLANRLSEDGTRRIILLEAGSAYPYNVT